VWRQATCVGRNEVPSTERLRYDNQVPTLNRTSNISHRGYLPTLDGWRAIAIVGVILCHDSLHTLGPLSTKWFYLEGRKGVDVFFAISGILICSRLLEEERLRGRISLRNFYVRRAFRILPAAFVFLVVIALLNAMGRIIVHRGEWFGAILFCRNYLSLIHLKAADPPAWFTGHFWSLSVEEHFYFLLPGILVLFRGRSRILVLSALTILVIGNRGLQLLTRPYDLIQFHTDVRLDALLIPALLTIIIRTMSERGILYKVLRYWPLFAVLTIFVISIDSGSFWQTTVLPLLMACMVMGSILHPRNPLGRFLELAPVRYVGRISYSLYLWQMLFFTGHLYKLEPLGFLERWPYNFMVTFLIAAMSYHLLEMPMIRLGHRIAPSTTPGRTDLSTAAG
jgi:peptidoglycan/LPS O-acetylase OafA/YrhL